MTPSHNSLPERGRHTLDIGLPWAHRPLQYDDWGTIRDAHGSPVCDAARIAQYTDIEADEARRTKTVPPKVQAIASAIVTAVNSHDALLAALKDLLLHACIADAAPDDVDEEDRARERAARAAIQAAEGQS